MRGIPVSNTTDDPSLGLLIGDRHEVGAPFQFDAFVAIHVVLQHTTGVTGKLYSKIQIFHYLSWLFEVVWELIRSSTLVKPSSLARTAKAGSVLILSKSENPSSSALFRYEIARSLSPCAA